MAKAMNITTNILCEATCFFDVSTQKTVTFYSSDDMKKRYTEKNRFYINPCLRPSWCIKYNKKRVPQFYCLGPIAGMKCPFLIISDCHKKEYEFMELSLAILEEENVKKFGKMFDYDTAMPFSKKYIKLHEKILKEFEKEKSCFSFKRGGKYEGKMCRM